MVILGITRPRNNDKLRVFGVLRDRRIIRLLKIIYKHFCAEKEDLELSNTQGVSLKWPGLTDRRSGHLLYLYLHAAVLYTSPGCKTSIMGHCPITNLSRGHNVFEYIILHTSHTLIKSLL